MYARDDHTSSGTECIDAVLSAERYGEAKGTEASREDGQARYRLRVGRLFSESQDGAEDLNRSLTPRVMVNNGE